MRILFAVNHPSQFHLFKNAYHQLIRNGHDAVFVIKDKDILEELMKSEKIAFHRLTRKRIGHNIISILFYGMIDILVQDIKLFTFVKKFKPNILIGTDYSITHVGWVLRTPSIVLNEDDYELNKLFCKLAYPLASCIVSPTICSVGKFKMKKISYHGYQKLAYLHPSVFTPNIDIASKYIDTSIKNFIIRLVSLSAGHDINIKGMDENTLREVVSKLSNYGAVHISNETIIPDEFEKYRLKIDLKDIHHVISYSTIFISDGQSMIVEAAMLGIPSIRFNSLVGKISVLDELENVYGLTIKIHNSRPDLLIQTIQKFLLTEDLQSEYQNRKNKMLKEKINLSQFLIKFIEGYPSTRDMMLSNPLKSVEKIIN